MHSVHVIFIIIIVYSIWVHDAHSFSIRDCFVVRYHTFLEIAALSDDQVLYKTLLCHVSELGGSRLWPEAYPYRSRTL